MNDIRYSFRVLIGNPAFTGMAVLSLALGIGVNTAIFSVVDSVLLRPLPLKDPERVVSVWEHSLRAGVDRNEMAPANYFDLRNHSQSFEGVGAFGELSMALGAQCVDVLRLVIKQGMLLTVIGLAIGIGGAFAVTRVMNEMLFGVTATDPLTFAGVPLVLGVIAFFACYIPARRATKVDPLVALRYE